MTLSRMLGNPETGANWPVNVKLLSCGLLAQSVFLLNTWESVPYPKRMEFAFPNPPTPSAQ
jgi:hypothetical protein